MLTFFRICKHHPFILKSSVIARVYIHAPNRLQVGNFEHTASDAHRKRHPPPYEQTSPTRIPLQNEIRAWVDNFKQITVFCHHTPRPRRHKTSESVHRNRIFLTILQGVFLIGPYGFANLWRRLKKITILSRQDSSPFTGNQWIRSPKLHLSQTALQGVCEFVQTTQTIIVLKPPSLELVP